MTDATETVDETVASADGTTIRYRRLGTGPGLVVLHGSMSSGAVHLELARALAGTRTVYLPDRRQHGRVDRAGAASGRYRAGAVVPQEVEDLQALLAATGARDVFAVSSGALITLRTALVAPAAVDRVILFEPPLLADVEHARELRDRATRELDAGRLHDALVTGWRGAEMGPAAIRALPRPLLRWMVGQGLAAQDRKGTGEYTPMRELATTLPHNFAVIAELAGPPDGYRAVEADVLLLGGSRSPAYLRAALDTLEATLPRVRRVEIPGVGHEAPLDAGLRGRPDLVAAQIRAFLGLADPA
jgi:pimeloyl-ACP methyl ester carboxylesterase